MKPIPKLESDLGAAVTQYDLDTELKLGTAPSRNIRELEKIVYRNFKSC